MTDQYAICLQNELNLLRYELKNPEEVGPMEGGFIAADPDPLEPFLSGNGDEVSSHLLWGIEPTYLIGLHRDMPGPAEEAS
jgi:hypothetical protein